MKTLTIRQMAAIKRVAQNVNPLVVKKNAILAKMKDLQEEVELLLKEIEGHEAGVIALVGTTSENLVTKVVIPTGKADKSGKPIKVTKYVPKDDVVIFDEKENVYKVDDHWNNLAPMSNKEVEEYSTMYGQSPSDWNN